MYIIRLLERALVDKKDERQKELEHLKGALGGNESPDWIINELENSEERNFGKLTLHKERRNIGTERRLRNSRLLSLTSKVSKRKLGGLHRRDP